MPEDVLSLTARGLAYTHLGLYDQALADFDAVLQLDPRHATALRGRGYAHELSGRRAQAIADYERARLLEPEDEWTLAKLRYLERQD